MKDPAQLLDEGASEMELALLRAGDADGPSLKAQRATLAALGLSGAVLTTTGTATAASGTAASGARLLAAKWLGIGALAATSVGGAYYLTAAGNLAPAPTPSAVVPPLPPPSLAAEPTFAAEPVAAASIEPAPSARHHAALPSPRPPTANGPSDVQAQVALIDRARAAVAAGDGVAAQSALDEYAKRFPKGVLQQEVTALRVEALLALGDQAGATRIGKRFLQDYPRSALAPRVRALTGQ